jgi:hypothetical protein
MDKGHVSLIPQRHSFTPSQQQKESDKWSSYSVENILNGISRTNLETSNESVLKIKFYILLDNEQTSWYWAFCEQLTIAQLPRNFFIEPEGHTTGSFLSQLNPIHTFRNSFSEIPVFTLVPCDHMSIYFVQAYVTY